MRFPRGSLELIWDLPKAKRQTDKPKTPPTQTKRKKQKKHKGQLWSSKKHLPKKQKNTQKALEQPDPRKKNNKHDGSKPARRILTTESSCNFVPGQNTVQKLSKNYQKFKKTQRAPFPRKTIQNASPKQGPTKGFLFGITLKLPINTPTGGGWSKLTPTINPSMSNGKTPL